MIANAQNFTSQQVIRSYLMIAGLFTVSSSLIWGVNTLFLLDAGLDIAEVFIANAATTVGMVLFEIPTGVLADTRGRRLSFLMSVVILLFGTLAYVGAAQIDGGLLLFCAISVVLGLGFTFYSGAVEAWLVDALDATGFDEELDHVFARGSMVTGGAMLLGAVGGGLIGTLDLALPYVMRSAFLAAVLGIAYFTMFDLGYTPRAVSLSAIPKEMRKLAQVSIKFGWGEPHIRLLMLVSFIQYGFIAWAFYAWQPYFLELLNDPDAVWVAGVVSALLSVATIIGNTIVEWLTRYCGKRTTIMLWSVGIFAVAMIGVGVVNSFAIAVILFLIAMGTTGVSGPVRQSYIHHIIPSEQRAAVLSVDSMFGSGGGIASQTGLGQLSRNVGIAEGYIVGGGVSLLAVPLLAYLRNLGGDADIIRGDAGHQGACAAQGLPDIAHVDAKPRHALETGAD